MRLFVSIDLPPAILSQLKPLLESLPAGRPVGSDQLHLTLFFLGEARDSELENIRNALGGVQSEPFTLRVHGVGCFPSPRRPRILWAGFEDTPNLQDLKKKIDTALSPLGFPPDRRPFHPHLTLSRIRKPKISGVPQWVQAHGRFLSDAFEVDDFHLYSSRLTPKGSVYTNLQTFHLRPLAPAEEK